MALNIVFHISGLESGGAERVLTLLANALAEKGHMVTIVVLNTTDSHYVLHPSIQCVSLQSYGVSSSFFGAILANLKRIKRLRKVIREKKADVVIGFTTMCNITAYFANAHYAALIVSERRNPHAFPLSKIWQWLHDMAYNRVDALVLQTQGVKKYFQKYTPPQYIIKNPLQWPELPIVRSQKPPYVVLSVGRLDADKNFGLLLRAFAQCAHPDWELWIVGKDGGEQKNLENLAKSLDIQHLVRFLGVKKEVFSIMAQAHIFAFPSKTEGYPNALIEAMSMGLPPLSTDCDFGPADIIISGENGFLVPNNDLAAFTQGLRQLMSDADLRQKIGEKATYIRQTHHIEAVVRHWEDVIQQCLKINKAPS